VEYSRVGTICGIGLNLPHCNRKCKVSSCLTHQELADAGWQIAHRSSMHATEMLSLNEIRAFLPLGVPFHSTGVLRIHLEQFVTARPSAGIAAAIRRVKGSGRMARMGNWLHID
jgi:hypothetical protein